MEGVFAWVTGIAWTNAIVATTTLGDYPDALVVISDAAIAIGGTLAGILWLVFTGQ